MKYIITESQYLYLFENYKTRLKRRFTEDNLKPFIRNAELDFPMLCDDFGDEYEFADKVISSALDDFLMVDEDFLNSIGEDYDELHSYLTVFVKDWFGEYLLEIYRMTCFEYSKDI